MLTAHHLCKSYGIKPILHNISFSLNRGERAGLIGPNGCGKSTLLRLLAGLERPDSGHVALSPGDLRLGYLPQGFEPEPEATIAAILAQAAPSRAQLEQEVARLARALAVDPEQETLQDRYDQALHQLATLDPGRMPATLAALGLEGLDFNRPAATLSGGQKTRLALALVLLTDPQLLLLDEPTNHLDIAMLEWLEAWLAQFPGAALIVSHDRTFLDRTVSTILELDAESHGLRAYAGNYTAYLEQRLQEQEKQWAAYRDQQAEIRRMRQDIARTREQARSIQRATIDSSQRRYAKKIDRKASARSKKLARFLESSDRVARPRRQWQVKIDFPQSDHQSQEVLILEQLSAGTQPEQPLLRGLNERIQAGGRVVLTGPNGAGKTTLLRTIAGQLPPLAGRVRLGQSVRLGYMAQEQETLDPRLSALQTLQAVAAMNERECRNFLHTFLFAGDDPLRPVARLSYGERARLLLACLVLQGCNFLLLDEPINHLDIPSRSLFEEALAQFEGTVLAVVHDRYFIDRFATEVWTVVDAGIERQTR